MDIWRGHVKSMKVAATAFRIIFTLGVILMVLLESGPWTATAVFLFAVFAELHGKAVESLRDLTFEVADLTKVLAKIVGRPDDQEPKP